MLQASPEFKGIKTPFLQKRTAPACFKPALNSKGLRLPDTISADIYVLQASPEFKGIKTTPEEQKEFDYCASSQP